MMIITVALGVVLGLIIWRLLPHLLVWIVVAGASIVVTRFLSDNIAWIGVLAMVALWGTLFVLSIRRLMRMLFARYPAFATAVNPPGGNYTLPGYAAALVFSVGVALIGSLCLLAIIAMTASVRPEWFV